MDTNVVLIGGVALLAVFMLSRPAPQPMIAPAPAPEPRRGIGASIGEAIGGIVDSVLEVTEVIK